MIVSPRLVTLLEMLVTPLVSLSLILIVYNVIVITKAFPSFFTTNTFIMFSFTKVKYSKVIVSPNTL